MPYILYIYSWILDRRFTPKLEELDLAHSSVLGDVKVFETGSNWRAESGRAKKAANICRFSQQQMLVEPCSTTNIWLKKLW